MSEGVEDGSKPSTETVGGIPKAPGELQGLNLADVAKQEGLPGSELNASALGAFVQSVAEEAARTGKAPTPEDWLKAVPSIHSGSFGLLAGNPEQNAVVRFQKIFLSGLTGTEDATMAAANSGFVKRNK